jgi:hypothetical protein
MYFLERMASYDPAFFSFLMLDSGSLESVLGRHGSWLSQILPWLALKGGASLETFLRAYSLSFILLYVLFFVVTLFMLKDKQAALAMIITCTVGYHFSFYYSTAELYQGLALCCMLWALIRKLDTLKTSRIIWVSGLSLCLTIWISLYHQLHIIPITFLLMMEGVKLYKKAALKRWFVPAGLMLLWLLVRVLLFEKSSYEMARMVTLDDFRVHLPYLYKLPSTLYFLAEFDELPALVLSILLAGVLLVLRKNGLKALIFGAFSAGFLVLVLVTDHDGQSPVMYENYYTVFGFFSAIVIAEVLFDSSKERTARILSTCVAMLLVLGLVQIERGHRPFSVLVDHYQKRTERMVDRGIHKAIMHVDHHPWSFSWMSWSTPFSAALISSVLNDGATATIYPSTDPAGMLANRNAGNTFLGPEWEPYWFTSDNLNKRVNLPDQPYVNMTTIDPLGDARARLRDSIRLEVLQDTLQTDYGPKTYVPVIVINESSDTLHARLEDDGMLRLMYWIDEGEGYQLNGQLSALDTDVYPGERVQTYLIVNRPARRGYYPIRIGLFSRHEYNPWEVEVDFVLKK